MTTSFRFLFAAGCLSALPFTNALAQAAKPAAKPAPKTLAKPAARPAAKPAAKPAPKPAPAPRVAAQPAPAPAPAPVPAPAPAAAAAVVGPFGVGTNAVNLGIGVGSRYSYGAGFFGGSSSVSPALSLSYERGILPLGPGVLGVGGLVGYQSASYDFGGGDKWKYTDIVVMVRGAFHYPVNEKFDAYGGLGLGVRRAGVSYSGGSIYGSLGSASGTEFIPGFFVGGRYFFTESIGAFAELGYDQTYLKVGLAAKF
ncbi:outer membrane beta-barrel protein [Hymenobacter properus]|uniref:Outer membrane beta-barrel protein n=1 Tax=Hymenobacter properus TaxID=2791026 RepID=A0A931BLB7_9BACT|nr:outer membrane beta-barrel protein [Hymenobacter properus]MBF9142353.1 outer membrane beta-barrel protein [Hymenobacter properus]MBR7721160.1 outer membrane beta-barrel protein [Microvirga sp. SRT04]